MPSRSINFYFLTPHLRESAMLRINFLSDPWKVTRGRLSGNDWTKTTFSHFSLQITAPSLFFGVRPDIWLVIQGIRTDMPKKNLDYPRISSGSLLATTNTQNIFFFFFFNTAFSSWAHNCRKIIGIRLNVKWLELRFKKKPAWSGGNPKTDLSMM